MHFCAESTLLVERRHSAVRKGERFVRRWVGYGLCRRYCSHQANSQPREVVHRKLSLRQLHCERTCRSNRMKMSRLSGSRPIPAYATWIRGTFFLWGSRKNGNGLGAPTAQKKSACAPCISSGKLKCFTVAKSSRVRPCASNT